MSIIKQNILFIGSKSEKHLLALFDSGASLSCINEIFAKQLEILTPLGRPRSIETAAKDHHIEVTDRVTLDFYLLQDILVSDEFLVIPDLSEEVIIGAATMQKWRIKLDFERDEVIVDPRVMKMQLI